MPANLNGRGLSIEEFQRLRLTLSTFQDGSGWEQFKTANGTIKTYPGYRQFERAVADVFNGVAPQNKGIFDVLLPLSNGDNYYGISCKMKSELRKTTGVHPHVYIEMANAAGRFMDEVKFQVGNDFINAPAKTGQVLLSIVQEWYEKASSYYGRPIDLEESSHLVLLYDKSQRYQLFQYPLTLPDAQQLTWSFRKNRDVEKESRALTAFLDGKVLLEWYLFSGGQLKYYPAVEQSIWKSEVFELEPLPPEISNSIVDKAKAYFPTLW